MFRSYTEIRRLPHLPVAGGKLQRPRLRQPLGPLHARSCPRQCVVYGGISGPRHGIVGQLGALGVCRGGTGYVPGNRVAAGIHERER